RTAMTRAVLQTHPITTVLSGRGGANRGGFCLKIVLLRPEVRALCLLAISTGLELAYRIQPSVTNNEVRMIGLRPLATDYLVNSPLRCDPDVTPPFLRA